MKNPLRTTQKNLLHPDKEGLLYAFRGGFGLEKESLRIMKEDGTISKRDHPFGNHPLFSRDFAESQLEIITPVTGSAAELHAVILEMTDEALQRLDALGETLHPSSNPPAYDPDGIRIAHFTGPDSGKEEYRRYLLANYGLSRMLLSGIHFNYSYDDSYPHFLGTTPDKLYLKAAVWAYRYSWLIVYLTGASPETRRDGAKPRYASVRCGEEGYWNSFLPVLVFSDVSAYYESIDRYVRDGSLYSASELYLPVRLKARPDSASESHAGRIDHIELRMLDLNPFEKAGIALKDLEFLHLFLIWCSLLPDHLPDSMEQEDAIYNMKQAALFDDSRVFIREGAEEVPIREAALSVLTEIEDVFKALGRSDVLPVTAFQQEKLLSDGGRYAHKVYTSVDLSADLSDNTNEANTETKGEIVCRSAWELL